MATTKRNNGVIRDKGYRVEYDAKDIRGINGAEIYTRAPMFLDHFVTAETVSNNYTDTKVNTGTFALLASGLGGVGEIATSGASGDANCEVLITGAALAGTSTGILTPSKNALERPISAEFRILLPSVAAIEAGWGLAATATQARTAIVNAVSAASAITVSAPDDQASFFYSSVPSSGQLFASSGNNFIGLLTSLATVDTLTTAKKIGGGVTPAAGVAGSVQADTNYHIYRVEVDVNGAVTYLMDDVVVGSSGGASGGVTATQSYVPYFFAVTRAAAVKKLDIDYLMIASGLAATTT